MTNGNSKVRVHWSTLRIVQTTRSLLLEMMIMSMKKFWSEMTQNNYGIKELPTAKATLRLQIHKPHLLEQGLLN